MTWSGDVDEAYPDCVWVVHVNEKPPFGVGEFGDKDGSEVSAYLVKTGMCK
jgi:hypothetical protein